LKKPAAAILTFPPIVFVPERPAVIPPAMFAARTPTVSVCVPVARVAPAFTLSVPDASTRPVWVTAPAAESVRLLKLLLAFRTAMLLTPVIVTVLVPFVKTEPAPLVSQFPESVTVPVVKVIVPLVPPVIDTLETDADEALAVKMPPLPMTRPPPVRDRFAVASWVEDEASETVRVPPQFNPRVDIVNVCADAAEDANAAL